MDNAFQYMDIIFLAVVAGVVLLRLRSVLGKRTESEKKDPNLYSYDQPSAQPTDIKKPLKNVCHQLNLKIYSNIFQMVKNNMHLCNGLCDGHNNLNHLYQISLF